MAAPQPLRRPDPLDRLRKKRPMERKLTILLDDVPQPESPEDPDDDKHDPKEWADYRRAVEKNSVSFTFRSMGRRAYEDLINAHPPTKEQVEEAKKNKEAPPGFNIETFAPAVVLHSCADPELTPEFVDEIFHDPEKAWNQAECLQLYSIALEVNTQRRVATQGKDLRAILGSLRS